MRTDQCDDGPGMKRRSFFTVLGGAVVALVVAVASLVGGESQAATSSRSPAGFILFAWWHRGREELAVVAPNGNVKSLASGNISSAAWSPDGTRVVFARYEGEPPTAPSPLFLVKSFTGTRAPEYTQPASGTQDLTPNWSPDRRTIAFTRKAGGAPSQIYLVNNDGTHVRPAATISAASGEYWPQWSRSGAYLAFLRDDQDGTNLVVVDTVTGTQHVVTTSGAIRNGYSWGPNDNLVYVDGDGAHGDLYTVNPDGTDTKQQTHDTTAKYTPVVSPDGRFVAYGQGTPTDIDLYVIDTNTYAVTRLTRGPGRHINPTWSPDSRFLAYLAAPPNQAKLTSEELPTRIARLDLEHPKQRAHILVTGKTEVIGMSWQPSPHGYPPADGLPFP